MSETANKTHVSLVGKRVVNVFLIYKHQPEEKYYIEETRLEKIKKLLNDALEAAEGCDGVNLIYDRHCGYDYSKINDLYNIADVSIYAITEGVAESQWVRQDIDAMNKRKVPIIPIRFDGYVYNIDAVCNKDTVDAMPVELTNDSDPTAEDISRVSKVLADAVRGFDPKKRDILNQKVEKEVKIENGETRFLGMSVESLRRVNAEFRKGFEDGSLDEAKKLGRKTPGKLIALIAAILSALAGGGVALLRNNIWQILADFFSSC